MIHFGVYSLYAHFDSVWAADSTPLALVPFAFYFSGFAYVWALVHLQVGSCQPVPHHVWTSLEQHRALYFLRTVPGYDVCILDMLSGADVALHRDIGGTHVVPSEY